MGRRAELIVAGVAFAVLGLVTLAVAGLAAKAPFGFESGWLDLMVSHRSQPWTWLGMVLNAVGGGWLAILGVPLVVVTGLIVWRRPWAAAYFVVASVASIVIVLVLKWVIARPRPSEIMVGADPGSFPSGHSANAAVIAATLGIIVPRLWVWLGGGLYTLAMMLSRTYLGAHWISDTIGGLAVGVGVAFALAALFGPKLFSESRRERAAGGLWET
jgi:undecaprenyl-diphosphatase